MSLATPSKAKIEHVRIRGGALIKVSGVIDEQFDIETFVSGVEGVVVVDLDEVRRITSYGVREWMKALDRLNCSWLGFVKCRPALVTQFNMVGSFAGPGKVLSLYLPYTCPQSGTAFEVLVDVRKCHGELAAFRPPPAACPESGTPGEFDDMPEAYLSYVGAQPPPDPPPLVEQLVASPGEASWTGLRLTKEVQGVVTGLWLIGRLDDRDHFRRIADGIEGVLYVSCEALTVGGDDGIAKFLKFLREVTAALVLDGVPLAIAERLAIDDGLAASVSLLSVGLPGRCPTHGVVSLPHIGARLESALSGGPLVLFCPECNHICAREFTPASLRTVATLRFAEPSDQVRALIRAHAVRATETTPSRPTAQSFSPGTLVLGRYQLVRALGAGGMAEVFLARQTALGGFDRFVVVKRILPGLAIDASFVEMFLQEARLAARLAHPNVVQIYDVGRDGNNYFIVMEFVRGWDLNAILKAIASARRPMPSRLAARLAADIARGLSAAHSHVDEHGRPQPIIHRDVSPHNVLVSADGHVKLTDFGIAKAADSTSLTPTSLLKGKASYMAPEQIRNVRALPDPRADVFAAGLVLYQMLTLVHPFKRDSELATFKAVIHEPVRPPSALVAAVPRPLDDICAHALAKDPAQRFASAHDLESQLEAFIVSTGRAVNTSDISSWLAGIPSLHNEPEAKDRSIEMVTGPTASGTPDGS